MKETLAVRHANGKQEKAKEASLVFEMTKGRLAKTLVPRRFMMPGTMLGEWYEKNPFHAYERGDILILRSNDVMTFWIRPVVTVQGYHLVHDHDGTSWKYDIKMDCEDGDSNDYNAWHNSNQVSAKVSRVLQEELTSKWNLEDHFVKVSASNVEEARKMYGSKQACN